MHHLGSAVFGALLLSPLFAWPGFGYDAVRLPAVLALLALLLGRMALSVHRRGGAIVGLDPLLAAALAFAAIHGLSLLAAVSPSEGVQPILVATSGVLTFAYARSGLLPRSAVFSALLWVTSGVGLAFAVLGPAQSLLGKPPVSTEGNTNYAGTLAAMLLPPALGFAFVRAPVWKRALSTGAAVALLAELIVTESRGGLTGALAGVAIVGAALFLKGVPRGGTAGVLALLLLVAVPALAQGAKHFSAERAETVSFRLQVWKSALRMLRDHPGLGVGAGNFAVRYPTYRSEEEFRISNKYAGRDFMELEEPHSSWAQVAVETGVAGLAAFLALLSIAARCWWRHLRAAPDADYAAALAGLGGGVAACLVCGFFNTLTTHASPTLLFWAFLGLIALVGDPREPAKGVRVGAAAAVVPALGALAAVIAAGWAGRFAWTERELKAGMALSEPLERIERLAPLGEVHPAPWQLHYELARAYAAAGRPREAIAEYDETLRRRPYHLPSMNNRVVSFLGESGGAEAWLLYVIQVGPYYYLSHYNLGALQMIQKRTREARARFARSAALNDRHAPSHFSLGETYLVDGDASEAARHFRRARELGLDVASALRQEHPAAAADPAYAEFFR